MSYGEAGETQRDSYYDIHEWNLDKSVKPHVMVRGAMGKDANGNWRYLRVSASGALSNDDANNFRISSIGGSFSLSADAAGNRVSALSNDADQLRTSSLSKDAGLFRVSAIGGTAGDNILVDGSDQTVSARIKQISAILSASDNALITHIVSEGAGRARVSALQGTSPWLVSAGLSESNNFIGNVSARQSGNWTLDSGSVSAKSSDGAFLRVSAVQTTATLLNVTPVQPDAGGQRVSARQDDAGLLRVSAIGGTAGDNVLVDGSVQSLSATIQRVSGVVSAGGNALLTYPQNRDDAVNLRISAFSKDGGTFRVSALGGLSSNQSISALGLEGTAFLGQVSATLKAGTANIGYVSAVIDNGSVSAKSGDANQFHVSSVQGDAGLLRISAIGGTAGDNTMVDGETQTVSANLVVSARSVSPSSSMKGLVVAALSPDAQYFRVSSMGTNTVNVNSLVGVSGTITANQGGSNWTVSAHEVKQSDAASLLISAKSDSAGQLRISSFSNDGALLRVSSIQGDAGIQRTSSIQGDAGVQRTSSYIVGDTVGQLTIGRLSNLSSSGNIKAAAGAVYGYYAYNTTTIPQYINFTNTSGAINVGTDAIVFKAMIPPSAAANVWFGQGLKGFTAGVGAYGTSAIADNATTPCATSAVGINVFYV